MPWSGWPGEWDTPNWWGRLNDVADTAWGALDLNSNLLATMPPYLVAVAPSTPTSWIDNPDPDLYNSWEEFAKQYFWDYQMGEAFVLCTARYSNGLPARFHVVEPWFVNVDMVGGRRRHSIGSVDVTEDMLHVPYKITVGEARGHGPLEAGRQRLVAARMLTMHMTGMATQGGIPASVLEVPSRLDAEQAADLQHQWITARLSGLGLPAVLSGGVTWKASMMSPKDMALVELLQFNESRIVVLLGVPPFLMGLPSGGDSMTYSNVLSLFDYHWRAGLRPRASIPMAALSNWLLPGSGVVELNRDAYVQPDPKTRAEMWEILIRIGVVTAEDVQAIERYRVTGEMPEGAAVL
jgi:HK97 family phage portal protein